MTLAAITIQIRYFIKARASLTKTTINVVISHLHGSQLLKGVLPLSPPSNRPISNVAVYLSQTFYDFLRWPPTRLFVPCFHPLQETCIRM